MTLQRTPRPTNDQITAVKQHLEQAPDDGRVWLMLAQMLSHFSPGGELQHAVDQSTRLLPDNYQAWLLAAKLLIRQQNLDQALVWLKSVAKQNPELGAIQLARASIIAEKDAETAISLYRDIMGRFPGDTRGHILLAELYKKQGLLDDAADCVEQVLHLQPENARYWGMLAEIRLIQGQWEKAVTTSTHAINLDRKLMGLREIRADAHQKACCWDEALADYREIEKQKGQNPRLLNKIGVCLVRRERTDEAAGYFNQALQLQPDFSEASINLGFLYATQMQADKAVKLITHALKDSGLNPQSRESALVALAVTREQQRLAPFIAKAGRTGNVGSLQKALNDTPADLLRSEQASLDGLWALADLCRDYAFSSKELVHTGESERLPFIEACAHCKVSSDAVVELWRELSVAGKPHMRKTDDRNAQIFHLWRTVQDRQGKSADVLSQADGEAWLKYWHARILVDTPEKQPGQYKAILNTIGQEITTAPACVAATYRTLLSDIRPTVPAGVPRGVFINLAMNFIHGFCDGNGRLSRFLLGWEVETAGLGTIVIPSELREEWITGLSKSLWQGDLEVLDDVFGKARTHTESLLQKLD